MKYLDEFRDPAIARKIVDEIHAVVTRPWVIMEICGGQTHSIMKNGIDQLLPEGLELPVLRELDVVGGEHWPQATCPVCFATSRTR